jgi:hypothetical protein
MCSHDTSVINDISGLFTGRARWKKWHGSFFGAVKDVAISFVHSKQKDWQTLPRKVPVSVRRILAAEGMEWR